MTAFHKKLLKSLPFLIIISIGIILFNNLFYSFCWSDEGFYISTLERIYQGQKLFIDDWSPTQAYCPIIYPFYWCFKTLFNTTDYIYLVSRITHLLVQVIISLAIYIIFSKMHTKLQSLYLSIFFLLFSRANIYGFSYYALSVEFLICGILCIYRYFYLQNSKKIYLISAGSFISLSVLCNPYLALFYFLISILLFCFLFNKKNLKPILYFWLGTFIFAIPYILLFIPLYDISNLITSLHYIFNDPEYNHKSLIKQTFSLIIKIIKTYKYSLSLLLLADFVFIIPIVKVKATTKKVILLFLNIFFLIVSLLSKQGNDYIFYPYFIFSLYNFIIFHPKINNIKNIFYFFLIPGIALSFSYHFASNTGLSAVSIGFLLITMGGILCNHIILSETFLFKIIHNTIIIFMLLINLFYRINSTYRDDKLSFHIFFIPAKHQVTKINRGPAKGLYSGKKNVDDYYSIFDFISKIDSSNNKSILITKLVPWGYISNTNLTINTPTTWRTAFNDYRLKPYYTDFNRDFPDYILVINEDIITNENNSQNNTWLLEEIRKRNYIEEKFSAGIIYKK